MQISNLESHSPIPVYSISKPFLAQAVLGLQLSIESTIGSFLTHLPPVYGDRRIDQLLNHTSGLGSYGELSDYLPSVNAHLPSWSREDLLSRCLSIEHNKSGFSYSNLGYLLLVMLVESETALPYFNALEQLVFGPLGITEFSPWNDVSDIVPNYDPGWVYSGTFLSPSDAIAPALSKLAQYRAETLGLSIGHVRVHEPDTGFLHPSYTYGFMVDAPSQNSQPKFVGHGGSGPGFDLMALVNTETWESAVEISTEGFVQSEAIQRLCSVLTR